VVDKTVPISHDISLDQMNIHFYSILMNYYYKYFNFDPVNHSNDVLYHIIVSVDFKIPT